MTTTYEQLLERVITDGIAERDGSKVSEACAPPSSSSPAAKLKMPSLPTIEFETDLALEQFFDTSSPIHCVGVQPRGCFNVVPNRSKGAIAKTAQKTAHQVRCVVMVHLRGFTFLTYSALAPLRLQKTIEFLEGNTVAEPQIPSALRTKLSQGVLVSRGGRAVGAVRSHFVVPPRTSTYGATYFLGSGCQSTALTAKACGHGALHEKRLALQTRCFFLCGSGTPSAASVAAKKATLWVDAIVRKLFTAREAFSKFALSATEAAPLERALEEPSALRALRHATKLSRRSDNALQGVSA